MNQPYIAFVRKALLFFLVIALITAILWFALPGHLLSPTLPLLPFFFLGVTLLSYYMQIKSASERFIRFVNAYMLLTAAKLLLYMVVIVIYVFTHKDDAVRFMIAFFLFYLAFTLFEVVALLATGKREG